MRKSKISDRELQARIDACVVIAIADHREAVAELAVNSGVDLHTAARQYVLGRISCRCGHGGFIRGLERYEAEQVHGIERTTRSCKVLGELRAMWQGMAPSAEDDYFAQVDAEARADREDRMDDILGDYWVVYVSGLSRTVRAHVEALLVDAHDPAYIASRRGHTDPETASLAWLLTRLHQVWCHWDSASPAEMLSMMRDYLDVVSVAPGEVIQA